MHIHFLEYEKRRMEFQLTFREFAYWECITDIKVILCVFFCNRENVYSCSRKMEAE